MNSLKATPNHDKSIHSQSTPYRTPLRPKQHQHPCPNCNHTSPLLCYSCCFQLACEHCFSSDHFINCNRQFNKFKIPLGSSSAGEESRQKGNRKNNRQKQKCKRCEQQSQYLEYCKECKSNMCLQCSTLLHTKGKFINHLRTVTESPQKLKRIDTLQTENCQLDQSIRKEKKDSFEHQEYGLQTNKDRTSKPSQSRVSKQMGQSSSSTNNRKGRSVAKVPFDNQENTPFKHRRKNSMHQNDHNISRRTEKDNNQSTIKNEYSWLICQKHSRKRTILTQSLDLVCPECFQSLKTTTSKLKNIQLQSWLSSQVQKQTILGSIESTQKYLQIKSKQLQEQFKRYKQQLKKQYKHKKQQLQDKYNSNIFSVQKWEKMYQEQISNLTNKCNNFNINKCDSSQINESKQYENICKLRSLMLFQQISKNKKDFSALLEQYQFRINQIGFNEFQDVLKNYSFVRRKVQTDQSSKNGKLGHSSQLRQSRISNSSMITDRKVPRNDSMIKSNYYQLSHGHPSMRRSRSKQNKQDLTKDISQRILFPMNNAKPQRKDHKLTVDSKISAPRNKNSYFFDNSQDNSKNREPQTPNVSIKDVKYINLETVINDKIDKTEKGSKKQSMQMSVPVNLQNNLKNSLYIGQITQAMVQSNARPYVLSDTRLTQSITVGQTVPLNTCDSRGTAPNSVNSSMQAVKNKRKSDYMQMRDRLRKPSGMMKICK